MNEYSCWKCNKKYPVAHLAVECELNGCDVEGNYPLPYIGGRMSGFVCSNCNLSSGLHCTVHIVPCCPGKCTGRNDSKDNRCATSSVPPPIYDELFVRCGNAERQLVDIKEQLAQILLQRDSYKDKLKAALEYEKMYFDLKNHECNICEELRMTKVYYEEWKYCCEQAREENKVLLESIQKLEESKASLAVYKDENERYRNAVQHQVTIIESSRAVCERQRLELIDKEEQSRKTISSLCDQIVSQTKELYDIKKSLEGKI